MEVGEVIECLFSYYNVLTPFKCSLMSVDTYSAVPGEAKVKLTPNKKKESFQLLLKMNYPHLQVEEKQILLFHLQHKLVYHQH